MNSCTHSLRISHFFSPIFCISTYSHSTNLHFSRSILSYSANSFFRSSFRNNNAFFSKCRFNKFLESPIRIDGIIFTQEVFFGSFGLYYDDSIACEHCVFHDCSSNSNGGSIFTISPLYLTNCLFKKSSAMSGSGGCVFCRDSLDVKKSSFLSSNSLHKGGTIYVDSGNSVSLSLINNHQSQSSGSCFIYSSVKRMVTLKHSNASECCNFNSPYSCIVKDSSLIMIGMLIVQIYTTNGPPGLFIMNADSFSVESMFAVEFMTDSRYAEGLCIYSKNSKSKSYIRCSYFQKTGIYVKYLLYQEDSSMIMLTTNCFDKPEAQSFLHNSSFIVDGECTYLSDCIFGVLVPAEVGYKKNPTFNKNKSFFGFSFAKMMKNLLYPIFFFGVCFGLFFNLTMRKKLRRSYSKKKKNPIIV